MMRRRRRSLRGLTLIEVMVTMAVISIVIASSATSVIRTVEQAHVDFAGAGLRTIWNAQRLYWIENRQYATDLAELSAAGLIDESLTSTRFNFAIAVSSDSAFIAEAERVGSGRWSGLLEVDQTGEVTGSVIGGGDVLEPGM